ncbi:MAG: hypothetical protein A2836_01690 [Candidatus Taylorbacteria bacterium RIFCSPHIGHO2_01_FULL_45_63]|uniref:Small ribosomal subunit protein bS20 n=1 Tax=Candidatus Taylorbacteria bacterium RIFCSPHIGHO2_02_FULL_45_35 TaxID=1802311 RepID=A0A1G2MTT9_9BACT|nr:MAG: hypothetical protein A2836_01690 [Candidatus Taylorbacteria bacterium RIFCSPHIGHO2_01_FULL_45_63]OHA26669.1 MAG: hypothetical protein A3D56_02595 [Candidatus Taylorbacteria bacterium RIFCSPHIGHO2_02_FULL_45_35]OHA32583.1 MAG: hypothetical protein A3A22_01905 [Candidatus Taylorbacteria bacterium RIFCSPLOWO2_01_FULL_45_34b]
MAITSSAKKAIRVSARKRIFNLRTQKKIDAVVRDIKKLATSKKLVEAKKMIPLLYKAIDKAVKTKFYKKNTAARMKSRLVKFLNKQTT